MAYYRATNNKLLCLFEKEEHVGRCLSASECDDVHLLRRRLNNGDIVEPLLGLYARKDYWAGLSSGNQQRHLIRSLGQNHSGWVFSHASAALMHNLEVPLGLLWPIHYEAPLSAKSRTKDNQFICHRKPASTSLNKNGARVTPVEQTVIDCAATYAFQLALPIADSALHQGLTDKARLANYLESRVNKRGVRRARRVIELADPRPDNGGESRVRALMIELSLPVPELQVPIPNPEKPGHYYYADFMFMRSDGTKVAMELDGLDKYRDKNMTKGRDSVQVMMAERQREAAITSQGLRVARFSYVQATDAKFLLKRLSHYGIVPIKS